MKASELVEKLNKLIIEHGDYMIGITDYAEGNDYGASDIEVEKDKSYGWSFNQITQKYDIRHVHDSFVIR